MYMVSNVAPIALTYAGAKIEWQTEREWSLDPALTPTEIGGWFAPSTRVWHDGTGIVTNGGSFRLFIHAPGSGVVIMTDTITGQAWISGIRQPNLNSKMFTNESFGKFKHVNRRPN